MDIDLQLASKFRFNVNRLYADIDSAWRYLVLIIMLESCLRFRHVVLHSTAMSKGAGMPSHSLLTGWRVVGTAYHIKLDQALGHSFV